MTPNIPAVKTCLPSANFVPYFRQATYFREELELQAPLRASFGAGTLRKAEGALEQGPESKAVTICCPAREGKRKNSKLSLARGGMSPSTLEADSHFETLLPAPGKFHTAEKRRWREEKEGRADVARQ